MFLFTTTTVINDTIWDGQKDARWSFLEADEDTGVPASANIKGVGIFKAPNITYAFKAVGHDGEIGNFEFKMPTATDGDMLRLSFTIALSLIDNDSLYANDYSYKGKKFFIDFPYVNNAVETAKYLEKIVKEGLLNIYSRKLWNLTSSTGNVTVKGTVPSLRFRDVKVEKLVHLKDFNREEYLDLNVDVKAVDGKDDFLTSDWITRNLRLPTSMRTRYTAFNKHENPIEGALYNQYTIHYCAKRGLLGLNAVGLEVTSTTTHVFFVLLTIANKFEELLSNVLADTNVTLETIPRD